MVTRRLLLPLLVAASPACSPGTTFIGASAEDGGSGTSTSTITITITDGASESTGAESHDTAGAPTECPPPCEWNVELVEVRDTSDFQGKLALDPDGAVVLVHAFEGGWLAQRLDALGEPSSAPVALADVPAGIRELVDVEIGADGLVAIGFAAQYDGFWVQRRSSDIRDVLWTIEGAAVGDDEEVDAKLETFRVVDGGEIWVAYASEDGPDDYLNVEAYDPEAALLWTAQLERGSYSRPQLERGSDGRLIAWATGGDDDSWVRVWRRDEAGTITQSETESAGVIILETVRRDGGWIFASPSSNGGIAIQRVDEALEYDSTLIDDPMPPRTHMRPDYLTRVGELAVVFSLTEVNDDRNTTELRVYRPDGALERVTGIGELDAKAGIIYDVEVAGDGSIYALGAYRAGDQGDFHFWLRRLTL